MTPLSLHSPFFLPVTNSLLFPGLRPNTGSKCGKWPVLTHWSVLGPPRGRSFWICAPAPQWRVACRSMGGFLEVPLLALSFKETFMAWEIGPEKNPLPNESLGTQPHGTFSSLLAPSSPGSSLFHCLLFVHFCTALYLSATNKRYMYNGGLLKA